MNQNENTPQTLSITRKLTLTENKGMTIVELVVYLGLLSFTVLVSATLIYNLFLTQARVNKTQAISDIVGRTLSATRNPEYLRRSLSPLVSCIQNPSTTCTATGAANPLPVQDITVPGGEQCYSNTGEANCVCSPTCSIQVSTTYQIVCPGGTGRPNCTANQASVRVNYSVSPHPVHASIEQLFQPIVGTHSIKPDAIWGDTTQVAKGGSTVELKKGIYNAQTANCGVGSVLVGIRENGTPHCQTLTATCGAGHILGGYEITYAGSTYSFTPKCIDIRCPTSGGIRRVFAGIDPVTEAPICRPLNPSNTECQAVVGGIATGRFMVGLDANSSPICRKKTCLVGEIFTGWSGTGDAICVSTGFIPRCVSPSCTPHALPPPGPAYFYTAADGVALGFEGIPYISAWSSGAPTQGTRHAWKNWGLGLSSSNPNNIFFSAADTRGATKTFGGTNTTCQYDATYAGNLTCLHSWQEVTRENGDCPADTASNRYSYIGANQCQVETWQCLGPMAWVPAPPPAPGATWTCTTTYGWVITGTINSETRINNSAPGTLSIPLFGGSGFTSTCMSAFPQYPPCASGSCGSVGTRVRSNYSNFVLVGGCNYVYTP